MGRIGPRRIELRSGPESGFPSWSFGCQQTAIRGYEFTLGDEPGGKAADTMVFSAGLSGNRSRRAWST